VSTYYFAGNVHAIEFLLVVCTRLCAVVGHKDQLFSCDPDSIWLFHSLATVVCQPLLLSISMVSLVPSKR
jgi:hypothetical protein